MSQQVYDPDADARHSPEELNQAERAAEQQPYDREFDDIANNYGDEAEHPQGKDEGQTGTPKPAANPLANQPDSPDAGIDLDEKLGAGFKPGNAKTMLAARLMGSRKRKAGFVGGIIFALTSAFVVVFLSTASGPAQFIQLSKIEQQLHMASAEDQGDDRMLRLTRDINAYRSGHGERTRMGITMNGVADKIEAKLNASGFKSEYSSVAGNDRGYSIVRDDGPFKGMSTDDIKKNLVGQGISEDRISVAGDKVSISVDGMGYRERMSFGRDILKTTGMRGVSNFISSHIMGTRAGLSWHPIKKLDTKITDTVEEKLKAWQQGRDSAINNGTDDTIKANGPNTDDNATNDQKAANAAGNDAADSANSTTDQAKAAVNAADSGDSSKLSSFADSGPLKAGVGIAAITGVACLMKGINDNVSFARYTGVILPLMRMSWQMLALGQEVMLGAPNASDVMTQLGFFSKYMYDAESKTNVFEASSIKSYYGEGADVANVKSAQPDSILKSAGTNSVPFQPLNEAPLKGTLDAVCGAPVQIGLTVISFLGGPVPAAIELGVSTLLQPYMVDLAHWLAGKAVDPDTVKGAAFGLYTDYGGALAQSFNGAAHGGSAMSNQDVSELNATEAALTKQDFQQQSLGYRMFAMDDPSSLLGSIMQSQAPGITNNSTRMASSVMSFATSIPSIIGSVFTRKAAADTVNSYDYGFQIFGFTQSEMDNPAVADPYTNADQVINNILPAHSDYVERAKNCFNVTIDDQGNFTANTDNSLNIYSSDYASNNCNDSSTSWLQVRMYIYDTESANAIACYQGDDGSCTASAFGSASSSTDTTNGTSSTASTAAPSGDMQSLAKQVLTNPNISFRSYGNARGDVDAAANGQQVMPGPAGSAGATSPCTNRVPTYIDPLLLQAMLLIAQKHTYQIGDIVSGHACDTGRHPKGRAMDIFFADGKQMTWSGDNAGTNKAFATDVTQIMSNFLPNGKKIGGKPINMAGIGVCSKDDVANVPGNVNYFVDACDELHVDVGFAP